jgi:3-hydroxyisobutyrate dehydrogenase-like beta-hydroxyacid dehydrogenase
MIMDVGFIGIGSMGAAMVPNLVKAGHQIRAWNRAPAAAEALEGVTVLDSPAAAFKNDAVITMLSDDAAVRSVIIDSVALASARKDCIHVMMATISPALSAELAEIHRSEGIAYVTATVFGIPAVAAKGDLTIMAAGSAHAIATVQPLLDVLGQKTWHLGDDPRRANIAKIAGNLMTLGLKDVNLALDAAKAKHAVLPAAEIVRENMDQAVAQGLGDKDWSALAQATRRRAGLKEQD